MKKELQNEDLEKFLVDFLNEIINKKVKKLDELVGKKVTIRCSLAAGSNNGGIYKVEKLLSYRCSSIITYMFYSMEKPIVVPIITDAKKKKEGLILRMGFSSGCLEFDMESGTKKSWRLFMADNKIEVLGKMAEDNLIVSIY